MSQATLVQLFAVALIAGLLLVGAEVFVPGGILGTVGALALVAAAGVAFAAFGSAAGMYIALAIVMLAGVSIVLWIRFFPRTGIGRKMAASRDLGDAKAVNPDMAALLGREGEALSDLRPGGYARIDGKRVDVITEGAMLARGARVRVVRVESNRVVVRKVA
ncbi:MAG: hypothetical protein FJ225_02210 [Lentisphaerae bacterium]|nr:hypothetical protein [Lentisphaerota bacterium]